MEYDVKEFDEIRPYEAGEMKQAFEELINDRQFSLVLKGFAPWLPKGLRNGLLRLAFMGIKTPLDFQKRFMKPVVRYIIRKHTDGCTFDDAALKGNHTSHLSPLTSHLDQRYTFVSNHRDIVLDSAFLDVMLVDAGHPTTVEIGIGDNLLIYPWIKRLVRMNKAFTVRRGLTAHEMMRSSQLMSRYIHYAVTQKRENIWIAQREGRAKDSSDRTQESVLKMLAMGGTMVGGSAADSLRDLNIVPLTISYEFDPCDYLKAQEMQQKRDNPAFKKSRQDDLDNMKTGIFGYKGRVHYHCAAPINSWIDELSELPKQEFYATLSRRIDSELHKHYLLYPCNYIAIDELEGTQTYADHYTLADKKRFEEYLAGQLAKIQLPDKDDAFLRECILTMYANPLRNYLKVKG
ncbi:MAG: acyltransferase [Prevotella sp.]|nr:acyltransferase [Prevotella sp.]